MIHIIDDDPHVISMLTTVMEELNYSIQTFLNPITYCEYASSANYRKPRVIITDVMMPDMNGYQLMKAILTIHQDIKFIVTTGYEEVKDTCHTQPHVFMRKPFHPDRLDQTIQDLINGTRNYSEASDPISKFGLMD